MKSSQTVHVELELDILEDEKTEESESKGRGIVQFLVTVMRILFGVGWLMAGVTKITEKEWFSQPGIFLQDYLEQAVTLPDVPEFYKYFIQHVVLDHLLLFNYMIPITQIILGLFLIGGFLIVPSVIICLFMHVNFILSGNMNLTSLVLYTAAFGIFLSKNRVYKWSLDSYWGIQRKPTIKKKVDVRVINSSMASAGSLHEQTVGVGNSLQPRRLRGRRRSVGWMDRGGERYQEKYRNWYER
ncbi:hypothetical protein [Desmospora profundinema]|uniref:Thiosulfate dehydrogenase [quinone] large subunit n=1 Tax=Desmospora profundinema TaxID=1571184 RepID=A0ABU1ILL9_9BACL|nr:hypothetical protein [Desmospora profundinema]MDR6225671.1 thiosulfate dehydrogenase [quinone] large subunit [Desmospora profundinema]